MTTTAVVFPGQGSQSVGMLADLDGHPSAAATFAEASDVLGYDLWSLVSNGPEEQLNQTEFTQPALVTASIALWRIATDAGLAAPAMVAGHSVGEYSALVAAGVLSLADGVALVRQRGIAMQTAVPLGEGGMAAVLGLPDEQVIEICAGIEGVVQAANFNAPGQLVIAGHAAPLAAAIDALKAAGAKRALPLSVSAPFHSELMKPAADVMADALAGVTFAAPSIPVIQNVHADFEADPDTIRQNLVAQMFSAVLWSKTIERIGAEGVETVIECGPGKVLAGLNRRIDKAQTVLPMNDLGSVTASLAAL